ncbi:unnamed protein product (macronuclear) [Paramecium tetraurelia]|uniref:B30.2/SPRY domain-containing protein n=1 Tax=Paramecium tetraurelia TaxID=5888 RepID=A0C7F4_PARTE|nr:uncharacterized protein GSPATT00035851001 [Paramecium tetraurelia]CAK66721.1 unnamed protein product [Paramecium tetraurelia]|eukprot:XP_001434118.1 hypothetical protein (macronuclear) [Paramecium tetraurelia strain d4-2]
MIPSTRICIAPNCQAQSRLIQSIKELDYHKGHSSSSLGQLTKKLKDVIPEFPITASTKQIIESKFQIISEYLQKKQEIYQKKCEKYELIEAASKFINSEYSLLNERAIDLIVKALPNNISETLELQTAQYCELQIQIQKELDDLFHLISADTKQESIQPVQQVQSPKKKISQIQTAAIPIAITEKPQFIKMPQAYDQLTKFEIVNQKAKHLEGYPSFVMTNQLLKEGTQIRFEIIKIQSDYVGIGIGAMERVSIEKNGLILTGEQLQTVGHGVYMNFNDKCIYHSEIENGAVQGKDKGISFQDGDKILCTYSQGQLTFLNLKTNSSYTMKVTLTDIIFIVWLDLSEIKII